MLSFFVLYKFLLLHCGTRTCKYRASMSSTDDPMERLLQWYVGFVWRQPGHCTKLSSITLWLMHFSAELHINGIPQLAESLCCLRNYFSLIMLGLWIGYSFCLNIKLKMETFFISWAFFQAHVFALTFIFFLAELRSNPLSSEVVFRGNSSWICLLKSFMQISYFSRQISLSLFLLLSKIFFLEKATELLLSVNVYMHLCVKWIWVWVCVPIRVLLMLYFHQFRNHLIPQRVFREIFIE